MSELIFNYLLPLLSSFFSYLYVVGPYIWEKLLFYPIGIALSLYILAAIGYMIVKASNMFLDYFKYIRYNLCDIVELLECMSTGIKYSSQLIQHFYSIARDIIKIYSLYILVFLLKRFEFYIFWLFVILMYC